MSVLLCRTLLHVVPQSPEQQDVSHDDHNTGDEEHKQSHEVEVVEGEFDRGKWIFDVLYDADIVAGGYVELTELGCVLVQVQRSGCEPDESPDSYADTDSQFVVLPVVGQRMSHDPVPLHAEAGDEQNRTVHVPVEEAHEDLAQRLSVGPVVPV